MKRIGEMVQVDEEDRRDGAESKTTGGSCE